MQNEKKKKKKGKKWQQWIYTETWNTIGFLSQLLPPNCVHKEPTQDNLHKQNIHLLKYVLEPCFVILETLP